jgi:hypothetical protein
MLSDWQKTVRYFLITTAVWHAAGSTLNRRESCSTTKASFGKEATKATSWRRPKSPTLKNKQGLYCRVLGCSRNEPENPEFCVHPVGKPRLGVVGRSSKLRPSGNLKESFAEPHLSDPFLGEASELFGRL